MGRKKFFQIEMIQLHICNLFLFEMGVISNTGVGEEIINSQELVTKGVFFFVIYVEQGCVLGNATPSYVGYTPQAHGCMHV